MVHLRPQTRQGEPIPKSRTFLVIVLNLVCNLILKWAYLYDPIRCSKTNVRGQKYPRKLDKCRNSIPNINQIRQIINVYDTYHRNSNKKMSRDFFYQHGLTFIPAWISDYMQYKMWYEISYSFLNFTGCTVEVWEWLKNLIPHFTGPVIAYPYWDLS